MEKAARLWAAAQSIFDEVGYKTEKVDRDFNERYISEARAAIGDEAFAAEQAEGRKMRMKNAIALALEEKTGELPTTNFATKI